jgi:3-phosphoshikimate 1-carboxyvinyltransferase
MKSIDFELPVSKSLANRYLILQWLANGELPDFESNWPDDVQIMHRCLKQDSPFIDVGDAGTVMRFLTAAFAADRRRNHVLNGSPRMQERPIKVLVDSLKELNADIEYQGHDGFPPIKVKGKNLISKHLIIDGGISSQYISALMMIAPTIENGLSIQAKSTWSSEPYLHMTLNLMKQFGASAEMDSQVIRIENTELIPQPFHIESDWSSASYAYALALLKPDCVLKLNGLKSDSFQGDSLVAEWYDQFFGVETHWIDGGCEIQKTKSKSLQTIEIDFEHQPDLAQTIAFSIASQKRKGKLTGLKSLRIKETDRIAALENELSALGVHVIVTGDTIEIDATQAHFNPNKALKTYGDHRMVMSMAPLLLINPYLEIENIGLVSKSFPGFWESFSKLT